MRILLIALLLVSASVNFACSRDPEKMKREYVESGDKLVAQSKYADAIIQYRNAIVQDARFGEARLKLGTAYESTGDLGNALREFVRAADLMPENADAQLRAAKLLVSAGLYPEAKARALAVLTREPKNVRALLILGNTLAGMKDLDGAISQVEEAIDAEPQLTFSYANLGILELRKGDGKAAEAAFKRAVELDPKSSASHLNLGNFYWAARNTSAAEQEFKAAAAIDPQSTNVNRALAAFYSVNGPRRQAEPYLKVLAGDPSDVRYKLTLVDYYLAEGNTDAAIAILGPLSQSKDGFKPAKLRLAAIDYVAKRPEQAYARLDELLKQLPTDEQTREAKARLLIQDRRFDDAIALSDAIIKANPQAVRTHFLRGTALEAKGTTDEAIKAFQRVLELAPSAIAAQMHLAGLHLARGDAKSALEFLNRIVRVQPRSGAVHFLLGQALLQSGNVAAAEAEFVPLVKARPSSAEFQAWLGRVYIAKRDRVLARKAFARTVELQPDSLVGLNGLVSLDIAERNTAAARSRLEARLARTPDDPAVLLLAGDSYLVMGDAARAEFLLRRVVELAPSDMAAYGRLARLYLSQHRLDEARSGLEAAAKRLDKPVGPTTLIGMILEMQDKPSEARKFYEQALAMDPTAAVAANNLAVHYADTDGNLDVALNLAQTAKSKLPNNAQVSDTLGWVYYKKGLTTLAIAAFQQGITQNPGAANIHYHLGLAYLKNGDQEQAEKSLRRALQLDSNFKQAEDAKHVLASMKG